MIKSVLTIVLSILAVSSAQLANVPKRIRNDKLATQSSSKNQDERAFGREKTSNLRNSGDDNNKQRNLQIASMSMVAAPMSMDTTTVEPEFIIPTLEPKMCNTGRPEDCPSVVAYGVEITSQCDCEGLLNCYLCSGIPALQFASLCGTCAIDMSSFGM